MSLDEIETYVHRAKTETFDSLFFTARSIAEKFNDQDEVIIIALATDIIWSYYQDLFATTHYDNITGNNETGKSSIGYTFAFAGYRPVKATSISAANYYRMLGTIEPGQCTFIEDEADNIEEDSDKMKILKAGYEYTAKVPKINMNSPDQKQNWFCSYCFKMIISEKPLDPKKAKGLVERTFKYRCQQGDDDIIFSIKEVITNLDDFNEAFSYRKA